MVVQAPERNEAAETMRVVIVGGVAEGMSAATRLRRLDEHASITVVERSGHVSYANCGLPYFVGGVIEDEDDLLLQTAGRLLLGTRRTGPARSGSFAEYAAAAEKRLAAKPASLAFEQAVVVAYLWDDGPVGGPRQWTRAAGSDEAPVTEGS